MSRRFPALTLPKFSFALLALAAVWASSAQAATSKFAGAYYGTSSSDGELVAAANLTVDSSGKVLAHGIYLDGSTTTITGTVDKNGHLTLTEKHGKHTSHFTGDFKNGNKNKFTFKFSTGVVFKGFKEPVNFPITGVYYGQTDGGLEGGFIVDKSGNLTGIVSDGEGGTELFTGLANLGGFTGETESGVIFEGDFDDETFDTFEGDYTDEAGDISGDFSGQRL